MGGGEKVGTGPFSRWAFRWMLQWIIQTPIDPVAVVAAVVCLLEYVVHLPFERQVEFVLFFSA